MILQLLFDLVFGFITLLIDMIPSINLMSFINFDLSQISEYISLAGYFVPLPTILTCITIIMVLDNAQFFIGIFNWVIRKIPSIN